jgi:hypothetical protein
MTLQGCGVFQEIKVIIHGAEHILRSLTLFLYDTLIDEKTANGVDGLFLSVGAEFLCASESGGHVGDDNATGPSCVNGLSLTTANGGM